MANEIAQWLLLIVLVASTIRSTRLWWLVSDALKETKEVDDELDKSVREALDYLKERNLSGKD